MQINISFNNVTPTQIATIMNALSGQMKVITNVPILKIKPAPYGLKKDGTPAKRRGRPAGSTKKKVKA